MIVLGIIIFIKKSKASGMEGFKQQDISDQSNNEYISTPTNPLGNVLLSDIQDNPLKLPAPPAFNPDIVDKINDNTKQMIQHVSFADDPSTANKLYQDLGDEMSFDHSMRDYYSTANSEVVPGDQGAFSEFLYGDMKSCRGGDMMSCETPSNRTGY
jgi:hypothetical protein